MTESNVIDGRLHAEKLKQELQQEILELKEKNISPCIALILIGNDPASEIYVNVKTKKAREVGIKTELYKYSGISQTELLELINKLNNDPEIHGILVQLPIQGEIDELKILRSISPSKDVDGFHPYNAGLLTMGDKTGFTPCTPRGCLYLLNQHLGNLEGLRATVIGRSNIVGRPMFNLLEKQNCTASLCHSKTRNLKFYTKNSDIVISAVGNPEYLDSSYFTEGVTVIDVGMNRTNQLLPSGKYKLTGDVKFAEVRQKAKFITPVPGGVGPMTVISLMQNTTKAAKLQNSLY